MSFMEKQVNKKPNIIELESLRSDLIEKTLASSSNNFRLFLYSNYFDQVLALNNQYLEEAFLKEFLDDYISCISKFEVWGTDPEITKRMIKLLQSITKLRIASENLALLKFEIDRVRNQLERLNLILEGKDFEDGESAKAFFPLIDNDAPEGFNGIIESVIVRINKASENDKFIMVPSEKEIEKRILEQCKNSWLLALNLSKEYVKRPYKFHEIIISFDKKDGFYEGNSLGIALTLSFFEQLLKFYNPAYIINIKEQSAFTGGVTEAGEVLCTSEEIIKRKVAAVFFSKINTFVFPNCEETYAYFALTQLKKSYPDRKLKLIPVEEINDVLNRRDIVDIKKQMLIVRSGKFVKKNWVSTVVTVLLAILFAYLFAIDFDDNPYSLTTDGTLLYVKNKNAKILWSKKISLTKEAKNDPNLLGLSCKLYDINSDGENEILITNVLSSDERNNTSGAKLTCYNKDKSEIWSYTFSDSVESEREILIPSYFCQMIDTVTIQNIKNLFVISTNIPSFSSAIYSINIRTGKRLPGNVWCSGHIIGALIKDVNNDGQLDILAVGLDNGFEEQVVFAFQIDTLTKVRPSTAEYTIKNFPIGNFIAYIRIPKTDFTKFIRLRIPTIGKVSLADDIYEKKYWFTAGVNHTELGGHIWVKLDYKLKDIDIVVGNEFRIERDTLVAQGKLNLPFTDTKAFKEIIKSNILYWNNGKWVKRKDIVE